MALINKDEIFKRRLINLKLSEDGSKWLCQFKVKDDPIIHDGEVQHTHDVSHQSACNVALEIMGNFCLIDEDEHNWWKPQLPLININIVEEDLRWATFEFSNGVKFNAYVGEATLLEVIENILVYGIDFYFDHLVMVDAYTVVRAPEENWNNCIIKVMDNFEVLLKDNANYPVTEDQIYRAMPYIYRVVAMLRGAFNSPMRAGASAEWLCALVSDMTIPAFEVRTNPSVPIVALDSRDATMPHANPGYVAIDNISYVVRGENQTPLLIVNE